jgi:hypothetical protein
MKMTRRPFLLLSLFIAGAALLQAVVGANSTSTPADASGELPPGMVCTACGPIYSADSPQILLAPGEQP